MRSIFKTTAALCGGVLLAISGSLACLNITHYKVYAEENRNNMRETVVHNTDSTSDINLPLFYSGFSLSTSNITAISAYSTYSTSSLQYSTTYGEWSESFKKYNCYAFALGKNDKYYYIGEKSNISLNITTGWNCNGPFVVSINNTIQQLADYTVHDLNNFGYNCVTSSKNSFFEPYDEQTLICVRKSKNDFHFMRYVNGSWLHKPGWTWILKYNSVPNVNEDWVFEVAYNENGKVIYKNNAGYPYTGDIYFIKYSSSHNYSCYEYKNTTEHYVTCKNCSSALRSEQHTFKFYKPGARQCKGCYYILYDNGLGQITMKDEKERI